jgi:ribonuclease HI
MAVYTAFIDGSCAPVNPGGTAISKFIVLDPTGRYIHSESNIIGTGKNMSNNVAEYCALISLLDWVNLYGPEKLLSLVIQSDSNLVVNQINGDFKIKKGLYRESALLANEKWQELETQLKLRIVYIPREENQAHDVK